MGVLNISANWSSLGGGVVDTATLLNPVSVYSLGWRYGLLSCCPRSLTLEFTLNSLVVRTSSFGVSTSRMFNSKTSGINNMLEVIDQVDVYEQSTTNCAGAAFRFRWVMVGVDISSSAYADIVDGNLASNVGTIDIT